VSFTGFPLDLPDSHYTLVLTPFKQWIFRLFFEIWNTAKVGVFYRTILYLNTITALSVIQHATTSSAVMMSVCWLLQLIILRVSTKHALATPAHHTHRCKPRTGDASHAEIKPWIGNACHTGRQVHTKKKVAACMIMLCIFSKCITYDNFS